MNLKNLALILSGLCLSTARAQEPPAARTAEQISVVESRFGGVESSPSVTVIGADKIASRGQVTLGELLRETAGVTVVRSGGPGQSTSVYIRGSEAGHVLVLIDGLEVNDASNVSRSFDFAKLGSENIERIEVYRGPQSVRFGSDAMGGVINVVTKKGRGPLLTNYFLEAGSYETRKASAGVSGSQGAFDYSLAAVRADSAGISAADESLGNGEADASRRGSVSARVGAQLYRDWSLALTGRQFETWNEVDYDGGAGSDDYDYTSSLNQTLGSLEVRGSSFDEKLLSSFSAHLGEMTRHYDNYPDRVRTDSYHERFTGRTAKLMTRQVLRLGEYSELEAGLQWRQETADTDSEYNGTRSVLPRKGNGILGEGLLYALKGPAFLLDAGVRHDQGEQFGGVNSFSVKPGYRFEPQELTLRAGFARGFKAPTLYQLYSSYGREDLQTEKASAFETSIEKRWGETGSASLTHFLTRYENLIAFDTVANKYHNVREVRVEGAEAVGQFRFHPQWNARGSFTHLATEDRETGRKLLRRPQNSFSFEAEWRLGAWEASTTYTAVSRRDDRAPVTGTRTSLHSYDLVDLRAVYRVRTWLELRARVENLFDRRYQEAAGYGTSGLAGFAGISGSF